MCTPYCIPYVGVHCGLDKEAAPGDIRSIDGHLLHTDIRVAVLVVLAAARALALGIAPDLQHEGVWRGGVVGPGEERAALDTEVGEPRRYQHGGRDGEHTAAELEGEGWGRCGKRCKRVVPGAIYVLPTNNDTNVIIYDAAATSRDLWDGATVV